MRICFIVDARSPIARNWVDHFIRRRYEVHVISTYPCFLEAHDGAEVYQVPFAFSKLSRVSHAGNVTAKKTRTPLSLALASVRSGSLSRLPLAAHLWVTPVELRRHVRPTRDLIERISPDIVHAMRIPFEGILAAKAAPPQTPLLISVWGNDFTLCARSNPLVARQTRQALNRADALHCDCRRDLKLGIDGWGFDSEKPATVLPGAGGIDSSLFYPGEADPLLMARLKIPAHAPVVINPRGFRGYVRNDLFFRSIPLVLRQHPEAIFVSVGMEANPIAERWVSRLSITESVRLLPSVPHNQMAELYRLARVAVSPSLHDGTPNTLLESMACGCLPVAFNIESVREWIADGDNGLLCDSVNESSLAEAISRALCDEHMRARACERNLQLIAERAEYSGVMRQAENFYLEVIRQKRQAAEV